MLHLIVLIWGSTGIVGYQVQVASPTPIDAATLVMWRTIIGALGLGIWLWWRGKSSAWRALPMKKFILVGAITGAHWMAFFGSIALSNVSTGLVMVSTTPLFVALLSPLLTGKKIDWTEMMLSALIVVGISTIFSAEASYHLAMVVGLLAAFLAALFSSLNARLVNEGHDPGEMAFVELISAAGVTGVVAALLHATDPAELWPAADHWPWLALLGWVATSFAFIQSIKVMRALSPFMVALTINLEPVYTIGFALWFFGSSEYMSSGFYLGAGIIVSAIVFHALLEQRKKQKSRTGGTSEMF